jgi:monomeric isocitrate dehydrogenase
LLRKHLDGFAPGQLLGVIDLAQIKHVPLHHSASRHAPVLDNAPATVFLAVFLADFAAQKHNGCQLCTEIFSWE